MKNFKLLLATTAILSTALAMGANATGSGEQVPMDVKIKLVKNTVITKLQDLDFGTIVVQGSDNFSTGLTVEIDKYGKITATSQGDVYEPMPLNDGHRGKIVGAPCDELSFVSYVELDGPGAYGGVTLQCYDEQNSAMIYGTTNLTYSGLIVPGTYTGTFVITHVLDEEGGEG